MTRGLPLFRRLRRRPYGPLILWLAVAGVLGAALVVVRLLVVAPAQDRFAQAEAAWMAARQRVAQRLEAKEARKNLTVILNALPGHRDFAQLPLAMSQVARRDRVAMPDLSYALEKTQAGGFTKAVLRGSVSGRYEDLRRFIHHLETADGFLFIEDLNVSRHSTKKGEAVAFQITLSTYIREGPVQRVSARALLP
ncbi:MAG TPA: type 4a pilus biogenesis protein PilO [Nitrospirales bacterium]|nr:type 4a pilus biogenesis protein PilO [Nitrospirales bacterium]